MRNNLLVAACCLMTLGAPGLGSIHAQESDTVRIASSRLTQVIDNNNTVILKGHVLRALTRQRDMGTVEESLPVQLSLNLKRTPGQQADLDSLLAAQQNPKSARYHQWLTPEEFGARFGASESDIQKIREWLESQSFEVIGVAKNKSIINFKTTSAGVRETFGAQLHYVNFANGKYVVTANEPKIPAALANLVSGIAGLNKLPAHEHHTPITQESYNSDTHTWSTIAPASADQRNETPQS